MKTLIVDDDAMSRELLSAALTKMGHEITAAEDGLQAWEMIKGREESQVVISDWTMPKMDGLELCRQVRSLRRPHYTYMVMLTVKEGKANYIKGLEAGADDFLTKPFDREVLEARLVVAERIIQLRYEVAQLERLLPICSYCKQIRSDDDSWMPVERYIGGRTGAVMSHGICPTCYNTVVQEELDQLRDSQP